MAGRLRYFLYRDDTVVSQFLEQLEGGAFDEENLRRSGGRSTGAGAGVRGAGLALNAKHERHRDEESEVTMRQTGASRFSRFYNLAEQAEDIQTIDACDDGLWDQLGSGEIVDIGVSLEIPGIVKAIGMLAGFGTFLPIVEAMSHLPGEDGRPLVDPRQLGEMRGQLPIVEHAASAADDSPLPVLASLADNPRYKMFVRLKRSCIQVDTVDDLEGEARLIGSIKQKVLRGKTHEIGTLLPAIPPPNREQRRSRSASANSLVLKYPAAVVVPIAVFR